MSLFKDSIKYGFVVCPAIDSIRSSSPTTSFHPTTPNIAYTFASMMMEYGYIPSKEMFNDILKTDRLDITQIFNNLKSTLDEITSNSDIQCSKVFYENFPDVPFNLFEQRLLAIAHYYSYGSFFPDHIDIVGLTEKQKREVDIDEKFHYKELSFASYNTIFDHVFNKMVLSKNSLPVDDVEYIKKVTKISFDCIFQTWGEANSLISNVLPTIVNKEILAHVISQILEYNRDLAFEKNFTVTDILRIATAMCNGDVSLAENTKFKLRSWQKKMICKLLLNNCNLSFEDLVKYKNKWVKLFHCVHPGQHSMKLHKLAMVVRENVKVETFNSVTERCFSDFAEAKDFLDLGALLYHLSKKPSVFLRNMGRMFKLLEGCDQNLIISFLNALEVNILSEEVPNRVLYQLYSYVVSDSVEHRIFFPKGMKTKHWVSEKTNEYPPLLRMYKNVLEKFILTALFRRFSTLDPLGKVYLDDSLYNATINNGLRNVTSGKKIVSRGCKVPFKCNNTLRMFMHWIGRDLDLSISFMDKNFRVIGECSFRQTSNGFSQHSGDIVDAPRPKGASEYVDIDLKEAKYFGVRYIGMHIFVYSGQTFDELEKCCIGWMERDRPKSNEVYDPRTVSQYIDLVGKSMMYTPVVFDIEEKTVCFVDMNGKPTTGGAYTIGQPGYNQFAMFKSMIQKKSLTLGALISLHINARNGQEVETPEEADIVFDLDKGITPYDYLELEKWM
jgi:hypothetical protein